MSSIAGVRRPDALLESCKPVAVVLSGKRRARPCRHGTRAMGIGADTALAPPGERAEGAREVWIWKQ